MTTLAQPGISDEHQAQRARWSGGGTARRVTSSPPPCVVSFQAFPAPPKASRCSRPAFAPGAARRLSQCRPRSALPPTGGDRPRLQSVLMAAGVARCQQSPMLPLTRAGQPAPNRTPEGPVVGRIVPPTVQTPEPQHKRSPARLRSRRRPRSLRGPVRPRHASPFRPHPFRSVTSAPLSRVRQPAIRARSTSGSGHMRGPATSQKHVSCDLRQAFRTWSFVDGCPRHPLVVPHPQISLLFSPQCCQPPLPS